MSFATALLFAVGQLQIPGPENAIFYPQETSMFLPKKDEWKPSFQGEEADDICHPPF